MGILESMFGKPNKKETNEPTEIAENKKEFETIHEDFKPVEEDGWHGNASYAEHFRDGTLPGFSQEVKISDRELDEGMLDDDVCFFPVKIKKIAPNEYWVYAYSKDPENANIANWIARYNRPSRFRKAA